MNGALCYIVDSVRRAPERLQNSRKTLGMVYYNDLFIINTTYKALNIISTAVQI